jgi:glutathione S-transferase
MRCLWCGRVLFYQGSKVLLRLKASGMLDEYPNLSAYVARGEARPAYKRAFDAQLAVNTGKQPTG